MAVLGIGRLRRELAEKVQGYPFESEIEAALVPFLDEAIALAYKTSEYLFDQIGQRLHGAEKAKIAEAVYDLLPDSIMVAGHLFPWKRAVSQVKFAGYLEQRFADIIERWDEAQHFFMKLLGPD